MADGVFQGAIGIDLGTTYSCVATYDSAVEIIAPQQRFSAGDYSLLSSFHSQKRLIGDAAGSRGCFEPKKHCVRC